MVPARIGDFRIGIYGLRNSGRKSPARRGRPEGPAELPEPGALRNRVGRAGSGNGLLRHRAAVCENQKTIREQTHCFAPTGAGKARVDDHGNCERTIAGAARWAFERQRQSGPVTHFDVERSEERRVGKERRLRWWTKQVEQSEEVKR